MLPVGLQTLRIAVVSDLHVHDGLPNQDSPSFISTSTTEDEPSRNPIRGIHRLIEDVRLEADILICPGDLADKAHPAATIFAWRTLCDIRHALSAKALVA